MERAYTTCAVLQIYMTTMELRHSFGINIKEINDDDDDYDDDDSDEVSGTKVPGFPGSKDL